MVVQDQRGKKVEKAHDQTFIVEGTAPVLDNGIHHFWEMSCTEELHRAIMPAENRNGPHKKVLEVPDAAFANQVIVQLSPVE
jgi:hypothetical protein